MSDTGWLRHEDLFMEGAMKKCIIDIQLTERPVVRECYGENSTNSYWFSDRAEGIKVVFPVLLKKTFSYKTSFVFGYGAIGISFDSENPFTTNWGVIGFWNKFPCSVLYKGIKLLIHCFPPFWIF